MKLHRKETCRKITLDQTEISPRVEAKAEGVGGPIGAIPQKVHIWSSLFLFKVLFNILIFFINNIFSKSQNSIHFLLSFIWQLYLVFDILFWLPLDHKFFFSLLFFELLLLLERKLVLVQTLFRLIEPVAAQILIVTLTLCYKLIIL